VVALVGHLDGLKFLDACRVLMGHEPPGRDKSASGASNQGRSQARSNDEPTAAEYERHQREKAARLWSKHRPMAGSIAERYLRQVRGIKCPLPATLAFLPPFKREHHPAMIAAFAMVDEPEPGVLGKPRNVNCVHLTLLKCDGSGKADAKPNKLIIARPLGRPIVVAPPNDLLGLAITEGIEDALAAHQATGLGAWAASAAGFMPGLADRVPGYIEAATIYAHDDHDGQNGAHRLAKALDPRGIEIRIESLGL
jgi:hypothetical protein